MLAKQDLGRIIIECIKNNNGKVTVLDVSKYIWANYEEQLRKSGDLFFTWQYDFRWQATMLRKKGILKEAKKSRYWEIE